VFEHFTDPRLMTRWIGRHAALDVRPGGAWSLDVNGVDTVTGSYLVIEPFSRLVFTWSWTSRARQGEFASVVEVTFSEDGDGTIVRLRHTGLPRELHDGHDEGWQHYLARLTAAATGDTPGPDPLDTPAIRHDRDRAAG